MTRRQAWFAVLGTFIGRPVLVAGQDRTTASNIKLSPTPMPARLSIDLDRWAAIEVTHGGVTRTFTAKDIFEALR